MMLKSLNEGFDSRYSVSDKEKRVNESMEDIDNLYDALNREAAKLYKKGISDIKSYEVAFQDTIERYFPDKSWWEVTDCNIFWSLFTGQSVDDTISCIIANIKPEFKGESVVEPVERVEEDYSPKNAIWVKLDGKWKVWGGTDKDSVDDGFLKRACDQNHCKYTDVKVVKNDGKSPDGIVEDTVKQNGKWVNKGEEGTHGKFKTKKEADAQRKAMFANGFKESKERVTEARTISDTIKREYYIKDITKIADKVISQLKKNSDVSNIKQENVDGADVISFVFNGSKYFLLPKTLSQVDIYDENHELVESGVFFDEIIDETHNFAPNDFVYELVGGDYEGTYSRDEVEKLPIYDGVNGGGRGRRELDDQPILDGYLGPMWNGWDDGHIGRIRYETQEVYDRLSDSYHSKNKNAKVNESKRGYVTSYRGYSIHDMGDVFVITDEHGKNVKETKSGIPVIKSMIDDLISKKENKTVKESSDDEFPELLHSKENAGGFPEYAYRVFDENGGSAYDTFSRYDAEEEAKKFGLKSFDYVHFNDDGDVIDSKEVMVRESLKKPKHFVKESSDDEIRIYMNTWKNYNENGADLSAYGIDSIADGWLTVDEAIDFAEEHAEDEPFINDTDNVPSGFEIDEYSGVDVLEQLKEFEDSNADMDIVNSIMECTGYDFRKALDIYNDDSYEYYDGVNSDEELGEAVIDSIGSIADAVSHPEYYIDEDAMRRDYEDDVRNMLWDEAKYQIAQEKDIEEDEVTDDMIEEYVDDNMDDYMDSVINDELDAIERGEVDGTPYFDYEAFGRDLRFDGFCYTDTGAIRVD